MSSVASNSAAASGSAPAPPPRQEADYRNLKEYRFLEYVTSGAHAVEGDAKSVLAAIDKYGWQQEWAMNLGDVKGRVVEDILKNHLPGAFKRPVVGVELGAYMGYSAIHFTSQLPRNSLWISVEINALYAAIATKMLEFAHTNADHGAAVQSKVLIGNLKQRAEDIRKLVRQFRAAQQPATSSTSAAVDDSLDLVFIDHWKSEYVPDFLLLEQLGFIGKGTVVIADNVIYPGAPEYHELLTTGERAKQYDSKLLRSKLEYSDKEDGVLLSIRK